MKVYLVFKCKDMKKRNKEFVVSSVHTTKIGALKHEARLHGFNPRLGVMDFYHVRKTYQGTFKSETQQTYIINKTVKGKIK